MSSDISELTATGHLAVLAGAGTGKTHLLARRYLSHLKDHSPLQVVAVTFTEQAAAELRARIRKEARAQQLDSETLAEIGAAPIGTIHALAARICREHAAAAGMPATFTVMDATQSSQWRAKYLPAALAHLREGHQDWPYTQLVSVLNVLLDDPDAAVQGFAKMDGADLQNRLEINRQTAWASLTSQPEWLAAAAHLRSVQGKEGDRLEALRCLLLQALSEPAEHCQQSAGMISTARTNVGIQKAWAAGELVPTQKAAATLRDLVRGEKALTAVWTEQDDALVRLLPALASAFVEVDACLFAWRVQQRQLDFADLERGALRALEQPEVRQYYQLRFRALLVDECQDTSPSQMKLLRAAVGAATRTYVGDPQQSVYAFRTGLGDVQEDLQKEVEALGGTGATLQRSYRAHVGVLHTLNPAMQALIGEKHLLLEGERPAPEGENLYVRAILTPGEGRRSVRLGAEANRIAAEIGEIIRAGIPVFDQRCGTWRTVTPGDIAILSRRWKPLDAFQSALSAIGVPAFQAGGGNLLDTSAARDALSFLRAAADPADDLAAASVLRGPVFGWSDAALHQLWRERLPGEPWQAALSRTIRPEYVRERKFFQELRDLRRAAPVEALLLAQRCGYRQRLSEGQAADRALADWDALLRLVTELEDQCASPRAAAQRLRTMQQQEFRLPRPPITVPGAVTLSSIHHAKGMEWPVVFVVDLDGRPAPESRPAYVTAEGIFFAPDAAATIKPALLDAARRKKKAVDDAELSRLLYVACTRVRDYLYVSSLAESTSPASVRLLESFRAAGVDASYLAGQGE